MIRTGVYLQLTGCNGIFCVIVDPHDMHGVLESVFEVPNEFVQGLDWQHDPDREVGLVLRHAVDNAGNHANCVQVDRNIGMSGVMQYDRCQWAHRGGIAQSTAHRS